jgi:hypothetical protein
LENALAPYQLLLPNGPFWDDPRPLAARTGDPVVLGN